MSNHYMFLLLAFLMLNCFSCAIGQGPTVVEISTEEEVDIKQTKLTISIYGYNPMMADVSADLVYQQEVEIESLPARIALNIPKEVRSKVNYLEADEMPRYYLAFDWDSNGDGHPNRKGDLFPKDFYTINLGAKHQVLMELIKD
jgi:hypothetical protein